tara:strand:+ start:342 stop:863 length:522 start_codon:yes stop_codon:yes gene_type:complete
LIVFAFSAAAVDGDSPTSLSFLNLDATYVVTFPESANAFRETQSSVNLGSVIKDKAPPVQTTVVHQISHFVVKDIGPANWVLLGHASDLYDASKWNGKFEAQSLLNADYISELEQKEGGPQQIDWLKSRAAREIPTTQTWVNLSHALTISPPAKKPRPLKVRVNATYTPPEKN